MRILVLHSDVAPDAPPDERDTLYTAQAIAEALETRGHRATLAPFVFGVEALRAIIVKHRAEIVFNMVEAIFASGELAAIVPALLEKLNIPFTGCGCAPMALAGDKPLAKKLLRLGGLPTPDWHEAPFDGAPDGVRHIVKSATEDASLGLDDSAVVIGREGVRQRAEFCQRAYGGRWFAEAYVHGREFNVSVLEEEGGPRVLPIPEMTFRDWAADRPRVVGHAAKWDEESADSLDTVRKFITAADEPALQVRLSELALEAWRLFELRGFARVDFRVGESGEPFILELNPNACLEPGAGFAAAAAEAGMSYAEVIERIVKCALRQPIR